MTHVRSWWRTRFLEAEAGVAVVVTVGLIGWSELFGGREHLNNLLEGNRAGVYGTLSSVLATFAGFAITAVAIVVALAASPRLSAFRKSAHFKTLHDVFFSTVRVLGFGTLSAFAGLVFDRDSNHGFWVLYIVACLGLLGVFRLSRCVWALELVVRSEEGDLLGTEPMIAATSRTSQETSQRHD